MGQVERAPMDQKSLLVIQNMRECSRACPAFVLCPLMPLAIQPRTQKDRKCLVNLGDIRLKVAYYKLFAGGADGIVQLMQSAILEYKKVLDTEKLTAKDKLRANEKLIVMLNNLHKMMAKQKEDGKVTAKEEEEAMDEIILVAADGQKPDPESLKTSPVMEELLNRPKPAPPTIEEEIARTLNQFLPEE